MNLEEFLAAISGLTRANLLTGHWDNKRNEMRKNFEANLAKNVFEMFGRGNSSFIQKFVNTEKNSRMYCEKRAVERRIIDSSFKNLTDEKFK